jgi:hypothetical protein
MQAMKPDVTGRLNPTDSVEGVKRWGYAVKTPLAAWVDEQVSIALQGKVGYFVYFAEDFNAYYNPSTSNPIEIYKTLDDEARNRLLRDSKIESVRLNLVGAVVSHLRDRDPELKD